MRALIPMPNGDDFSSAIYDDTDTPMATDDEGFGPEEDSDAPVTTEDNDFSGLGGLFDIQIGAGTLAVAAIAAYFLLKKKGRA
jgi:hypothetical protein